MKRAALFFAAVFIVVTFSQAAWAFRCGAKLVREGDHSFVVKKACGEPEEREVVGYTITPNGKREMKIEKWIYGPKEGRYYILTFEGGVLKEIDSVAAK